MKKTETIPHIGQICSISIAEPKDAINIYQQFKKRWASLIYRTFHSYLKVPHITQELPSVQERK